jgi:hypothetical protein
MYSDHLDHSTLPTQTQSNYRTASKHKLELDQLLFHHKSEKMHQLETNRIHKLGCSPGLPDNGIVPIRPIHASPHRHSNSSNKKHTHLFHQILPQALT